MGKLEGKIAVVTGGTSGIGLATTKRFIAEGAFVYIIARQQKQLDSVVKELGPRVKGIQGDVSNLAALDRLYQTVANDQKRIDVVFANAATATLGSIGHVTDSDFDANFEVNVKGVFFTVQKALPLMNVNSSIVLTGSTSGSKGLQAISVYAATKAAVRNFARSWTLDLKGSGIRVNVIAPGTTNTPGLSAVMDKSGSREQFLNGFTQATPLGRLAEPSEIAAAALFLASDDSSYMAGSELFVDGGMAQV